MKKNESRTGSVLYLLNGAGFSNLLRDFDEELATTVVSNDASGFDPESYLTAEPWRDIN